MLYFFDMPPLRFLFSFGDFNKDQEGLGGWMDSHFDPWVMLHMLPKIPTVQADSYLLSGSTNTYLETFP